MPRPPQYSDEELLEALRELASKLDRVPRKKDMNEYGSHAARTYQLRFGTWNGAVQEAGFEPRSKGTGYGERPDACPLCGSEQTGLDFHHWRYGENEQGCYLCRTCHDDVHTGDAGTDNPNWLLHCIGNLVALHIEYQYSDGDTLEESTSGDVDTGGIDVRRVIDRYNLPENPDLVETAIQIGRDS